jgi:hypothetical protein
MGRLKLAMTDPLQQYQKPENRFQKSSAGTPICPGSTCPRCVSLFETHAFLNPDLPLAIFSRSDLEKTGGGQKMPGGGFFGGCCGTNNGAPSGVQVRGLGIFLERLGEKSAAVRRGG